MSDAKKKERVEQVYDYLLTIADPHTGKVSVSGDQIGKELKIAANSARLYLSTLVKLGRVIQLTEIKRGAVAMYRVPALCRGDVQVTKIEPAITWRDTPPPPKEAAQVQMENPPCEPPKVTSFDELRGCVYDADRLIGDMAFMLSRMKRAAEAVLSEVSK